MKPSANALWHLVAAVVALTAPAQLTGQSAPATVEIHAILTGLDLESSTGESSAGLGLRAGWNVSPGAGFEAEWAYFPENPQGNYGHSLVLAGLRAGHRWGRFGLRAKARPGLLHLGGSSFRRNNATSLTVSALDLGLAFEYHFPRRALLRFDLGMTAAFFGNTTIVVPALDPEVTPGTTWNRQATVAVGVGL